MRHLFNSVRVYMILFLLTASMVVYIVYQHVLYIKKERQDFLCNYHNDDEEEDDKPKGKLFKNKRMYVRNIYKIKSQIKWFNKRQRIYNSYLGPITNKTYVIVIQCHSNVYHLQQLLDSLSNAFFINTALLIFSHDHYSHKINKLIKTVNFAKYMQIFYPYSMQLHPNIFPGAEPKTCVEGFPCIKSKARDPEAAQSKHHWWWQANQIFDHLKVLKNFNEPILFLEEDNYVTADVLVVYRLLIFARFIHCPFCEMISLAAHKPELSQYRRRKSIVTVEVWTQDMPRTAIAFNRKTWTSIKASKDLFCFYNDSNWDSSLKNIGAKKWEGNIYITSIDGPRVFRIEKCDNKDINCKMHNKVDEVKTFIKLISKRMYPLSIKVKVMAAEDNKLNETGYWSDVRDHELCMHFTQESVWF